MQKRKYVRVDMTKLAEFVRLGIGVRDAAKILGCSPSTISVACRRLSNPPPQLESKALPAPKPSDPTAERVRVLLVEGWTLAEIAELLSLPATEVRAANARLRMRYKRAMVPPKPPSPEAPRECKRCGQPLPPKRHRT